MIKSIVQLYRRAYSGLPREAWFLFAVNLVNSSGAMVIFFLSLYLTRRLGFTPVRAGRRRALPGQRRYYVESMSAGASSQRLRPQPAGR